MANRKGKVSFDRAARKEAIANVMNSNPDMSYAAILPLIVKAADLRESFAADAALRRAGDYYKWLVKSGYAKGTLPTRGAGKTATPKVKNSGATPKVKNIHAESNRLIAKIVKPKKVKVTRAMQKAVAAKVEKTDAEIAAIKAKNLETMKKVSKNITRFEDRLSKEVEELNKQSDDFEKLDLREFVPSYLLKEKYVE
jgi:hypothetical protein